MITSANESISRRVRKDNTILYESNRYSIPLSPCTREEKVCVEIQSNKLIILQIYGNYVIDEHTLCIGKGKLIETHPIAAIVSMA